MIRARTKESAAAQCGFGCLRPRVLRPLADIRIFVVVMCLVIAVQGAYLGYMVGVLTTLERRFELSTASAGLLLAMYDVGHTVSVMFVGQLGASRHKPRWTAIGVLLSAVAMFCLTLPNWIFGATSHEERVVANHAQYVADGRCDPSRAVGIGPSDGADCEQHAHGGAFALLVGAQVLAGMAAAPFNTLAYVYVDDNVANRQSPFYLGMLTSMYAFGPAFGFALSSFSTGIYVSGTRPPDLDATSPNWVGAWWLGFIVCGLLYVILSIPLLMFPFRLKNTFQTEDYRNEHEMATLQDGRAVDDYEEQPVSCQPMLDTLRELPRALCYLVKNPVYVGMVIGWIFGSYLVGGYGTFLPKYLESQYGQTMRSADIYAGIISIGSVAVSTAVGGFILTRCDIRPRRALLLLICSWSIILVTYVIGMGTGCAQPALAGQVYRYMIRRWNFTNECNSACHCFDLVQFDPICSGGLTHFSPCHAGCQYDDGAGGWTACRCAAEPTNAAHGYCETDCAMLPVYLVLMFVGLFVGNLFFMTTMMVVLRCVPDEAKALALSFASGITNILGFIPSPIVFGALIDSACVAWHSLCPHDAGNCILYDNADFRHKYHMGNAFFQLVAIAAVAYTFVRSRSFTFPEDMPIENVSTDSAIR